MLAPFTNPCIRLANKAANSRQVEAYHVDDRGALRLFQSPLPASDARPNHVPCPLPASIPDATP